MSKDRTLTIRGDGPGAGSHEPGGPRPGLVVVFSEGTIPGAGVHPGLPRTTIGRAADQHVFVQDRGMSRTHAVLSFAKTMLLRDLGSHNGTYLNGRRITQPQPVAMMDVVRCGTTLLIPVPDIAAFKGWPDAATRGPLIGGPEMQFVMRTIDLLVAQEIDVLITGESGTGKELAAGLLHQKSGRKGPLVGLNCAAIPEALFEAELFGVKRGAFTGATADRPGLMQQASGGMLFLDEIGEMPLTLQPKLLRSVELRQVRPVGGNQPVRVDVRLAAATNRDLAAEVARGRFREDLYHRLCGVNLWLPPLRERRYDILILARHLLEDTRRPAGGDDLQMSAEFAEQLLLRPWTGNVRELRRVIQEAQLRAAMEGAPRLLVSHMSDAGGAGEGDEIARIRAALTQCNGNVVAAATALGIGRSTLYRLLKEHRLVADHFRRRE